MSTYGFLGLGIMGRAMAHNLIDAGHRVVVWNRTPDRCSPLVDAGAIAADSPAEVVEACPATFAMVADPAAAWALCFGPGGVLEGIGSGVGYIDMSTVDPRTSMAIGTAVTEHGGRFIEAPVSGSRKPAEDGALVIMAAGDRTLFDEVWPAFEVLGRKTVFLGETGNGARMKLVVNLVMGAAMTALCEGIALADRAELPLETLIDVLDAGAMASPMFHVKGHAVIQRDYETQFPLKHAQKDLRLALKLGDELALALPTAATANELFKRARELGADDEDLCAVDRAIRSSPDGTRS